MVKKIARTHKLNFLGLCAGGITVSYVLAHLATIGDDSAGSATFVVTMLTGDKPNVVGMIDTSEARAVLEKAAAAEQIVPGTGLRSLFAMLRPNDLVFNYLVSGWLMGKSPAPFDVLAWNDDATRTTAKFASESTKLAMDGWDGSGPTLLGVKTDFSKVTCDTYHVGGYTDHITAWRACYDTAHLVGGADKEMTLIRSGHIQSVVYPADSTRYDRWFGLATQTDPDEWIKTATVERGSWWRPWTEWLIARSGNGRQARTTLGNRQYPPLGPAPAPTCTSDRMRRLGFCFMMGAWAAHRQTGESPVQGGCERAAKRSLRRASWTRSPRPGCPPAAGRSTGCRCAATGASHAIHMAAITQIRHKHSDGRACYDRKIAEGKTHKQALRWRRPCRRRRKPGEPLDNDDNKEDSICAAN